MTPTIRRLTVDACCPLVITIGPPGWAGQHRRRVQVLHHHDCPGRDHTTPAGAEARAQSHNIVAAILHALYPRGYPMTPDQMNGD